MFSPANALCNARREKNYESPFDTRRLSHPLLFTPTRLISTLFALTRRDLFELLAYCLLFRLPVL